MLLGKKFDQEIHS